MPRKSSALTVAAIRKAKPAKKPVKLTDGEGMYLLLKPDGSRYWRLDYRFEGKRKTLALGVYPEVTMTEARARRAAARALLAKGRDPAASMKRRTRVTVPAAENSGDRAARKTDSGLLARRQCLLQTIATVSEMLLANVDETELMQRVCQTLIDDRLFRMAWICRVGSDGITVHPVAQAGFAGDYLDNVDILCDTSPRGRGPTGTAIRLNKTVVNDDTESNRRFAPWRERARAGLSFLSRHAHPPAEPRDRRAQCLQRRARGLRERRSHPVGETGHRSGHRDGAPRGRASAA